MSEVPDGELRLRQRELVDIALDAAARSWALGVQSERGFVRAREFVQPQVEAALRDVLRRRFELVEQLAEAMVDRKVAQDPESPDARFRAGVEFGLAWSALTFGVDVAASPQRETELDGWLEAHASEGVQA